MGKGFMFFPAASGQEGERRAGIDPHDPGSVEYHDRIRRLEAGRIEAFAAHGPVRTFKRVFRDCTWDTIYRERLQPLLWETVGAG
jgi:hypothetical protein